MARQQRSSASWYDIYGNKHITDNPVPRHERQVCKHDAGPLAPSTPLSDNEPKPRPDPDDNHVIHDVIHLSSGTISTLMSETPEAFPCADAKSYAAIYETQNDFTAFVTASFSTGTTPFATWQEAWEAYVAKRLAAPASR